MARFARLFLVTAVAATMVGMFTVAAFAGQGCSASKQASAGSSCSASAKMASAEGGSCGAKAKMASSEGACASKSQMTSAECKALCAQSMASLASMEPFKFMKDVNAEHVNVQVESTDNGFAFVFAGVNEQAIPEAKQAGMLAVQSINKPAACSMTRSAMAEKGGDCEYTKACLSALADAQIEMVETEQGAKAVIFSKDEAKVKELHAFLQQITAPAEPVSKS